MPRAKTLRGSIREHVPTVDNADTTDALVVQAAAWYTNRETARVVDRKGARTARRNADPVATQDNHPAYSRAGVVLPGRDRVKKVVVPVDSGTAIARGKFRIREDARIAADRLADRTQVFTGALHPDVPGIKLPNGAGCADVITADADRWHRERAHQAARNMAARRRAGLIGRGGK